jgi:hypothetical protein
MSQADGIQLTMKLHGAPKVHVAGTRPVSLRGHLTIAFIATLITGAQTARSRPWLVDTLWSDASAERGRANLRQLLHSLRISLETDFELIFDTSPDRVALRAGVVTCTGGPEDGAFLEGIDLAQEGFEDWLRAQRQKSPALPRKTEAAPACDTEGHSVPRIMVLPFAELADRALSLSARDPRRPFFETLAAGSYVAGGRYPEAVEMAEASLRINPLHLSAHRCRVIGLYLFGRGRRPRDGT